MKYPRIMLKLSGEVLEGKNGSGIDFQVVSKLVQEIKEVKSLGVDIALVIGGGNIWRFRDFQDSGLDRVVSDYMGMLATIMNAMAMEDYLRKAGVKARALSAISMPTVTEPYIRAKAVDYLEKGAVVLCAGGTGSPYFTTDSAAALRALELNCDVLLKATKVDYVYDKDPKKFPDAKKFETLTYQEMLQRELLVMDLSAVSLCMERKLPIIVFNLEQDGNIPKAVQGEKVGTLIS